MQTGSVLRVKTAMIHDTKDTNRIDLRHRIKFLNTINNRRRQLHTLTKARADKITSQIIRIFQASNLAACRHHPSSQLSLSLRTLTVQDKNPRSQANPPQLPPDLQWRKNLASLLKQAIYRNQTHHGKGSRRNTKRNERKKKQKPGV